MVERICISIEPDVLERVDRAAQLLHTSRSALLRRGAERIAREAFATAPEILDARRATYALEADR